MPNYNNFQTEWVGNFTAPRNTSKKIGIVASKFNSAYVDGLIAGAKEQLLRHGVDESQIELLQVPGAFELPMGCTMLAKTNRFAGLIALGVVIRGSTSHFDYVAGGACNGIMQVQLKHDLPIMLGVLTTENMEQAQERSGSKMGNKGGEAALALLEMLDLGSKVNE